MNLYLLVFLFAADSCLNVLFDFSLTVKAATLIFISGRGSAISSAMEGTSGFIYNLVNSKSCIACNFLFSYFRNNVFIFQEHNKNTQIQVNILPFS